MARSKHHIPQSGPRVTELSFKQLTKEEACRRRLVEDSHEHGVRTLKRLATRQMEQIASQGAVLRGEKAAPLAPLGSTVATAENAIAPAEAAAREKHLRHVAKMRHNYFVDRVNRDLRHAAMYNDAALQPPDSVVAQLQQEGGEAEEVGRLGLYDPSTGGRAKVFGTRGKTSRRKSLRQHPVATVDLFEEEGANRDFTERHEDAVWEEMMAAARALHSIAEQLCACRVGQDSRRAWTTDSAVSQLVELKGYERRRRRLLFMKHEKKVREYTTLLFVLGFEEEVEWFARESIDYERLADGRAIRASCEADHQRLFYEAHLHDRVATVGKKEQQSWDMLLLKHRVAVGQDKRARHYHEMARRLLGVEPYESSLRAGTVRDEERDFAELVCEWDDDLDDFLDMLVEDEELTRATLEDELVAAEKDLQGIFDDGAAAARQAVADRLEGIAEELVKLEAKEGVVREGVAQDEDTARRINLTCSEVYDAICVMIPKLLLARAYEPLYAAVVADEAAARPKIATIEGAVRATLSPLLNSWIAHETGRVGLLADEGGTRAFLADTQAYEARFVASWVRRRGVEDDEVQDWRAMVTRFDDRLCTLEAIRRREGAERVWMSGLDFNTRETAGERAAREAAQRARDAKRVTARDELAPIYLTRGERAARCALQREEVAERARVEAFAVYFPWLRMCCSGYPKQADVQHPYVTLLRLYKASVAAPGAGGAASGVPDHGGLVRLYDAVAHSRKLRGEDAHVAAPLRRAPFAEERATLGQYHVHVAEGAGRVPQAKLLAAAQRTPENVAPAVFRARAGCSVHAFLPVPWDRFDVAFMAGLRSSAPRLQEAPAAAAATATATSFPVNEVALWQDIEAATPQRAERWGRGRFTPNTTGGAASEWGLSTMNTTASAGDDTLGSWSPHRTARTPHRPTSYAPPDSPASVNLDDLFDEDGRYLGEGREGVSTPPREVPTYPPLFPKYVEDVVYGQGLKMLHTLSSLIDARRGGLRLDNHVTLLIDSHLRDKELLYAAAVLLTVAGCAAAVRTSVLRPQVHNVLRPIAEGYAARRRLAAKAFAPNVGLGLLLSTAKRTPAPGAAAEALPWSAYTAVYQPHARPPQTDATAALARCLGSGRRRQGLELYLQAKLRSTHGLQTGLWASALVLGGGPGGLDGLVRNKAACRIQTCVRGFLRRVEALKARHALLVKRDEEVEKAALQEEAWVAAVAIQRVWRGWKGWCRGVKRQYDALMDSFRSDPANQQHFAREIQKVFRAFVARNRMYRLQTDQEAAAYRQLHTPYARTIQRFYRGFVARKRVVGMEYAALEADFKAMWEASQEVRTIQRVTRGWRDRGDVVRLQYKQMEAKGRQHCAREVQRVYRGHLGRQRALQKHAAREAAAVEVQRVGRGYLDRRDGMARAAAAASLTQRAAAVIKIQKVVRGEATRNKLLRKKYLSLHSDGEAACAVHLQSVFRGFKTREMMDKAAYEKEAAEYNEQMAASAIPIQRLFRGHRGRKAALAKQYDGVVKEYRAYDAVYQQHADVAARAVQKIVRGMLGRRRAARRAYLAVAEEYHKEADPYARTVQRYYRGECGRREAVEKNYRLLEQAYNLSAAPHALTIQRIYRGHRGRRAATAQREHLLTRIKNMQHRRRSTKPRPVPRARTYLDRGVAL
eukprot:TRINITY_DN18457_c0_g1_i1.p1 TRINITY_DN18457_c0_g1~~TRINITY_DN18457_c0_g1_i1.p1  ORF type:complete len:1780 (+),score=585.21 TRINITY_DN18457_c0_g1_i1:378-5342(+)